MNSHLVPQNTLNSSGSHLQIETATKKAYAVKLTTEADMIIGAHTVLVLRSCE